MTRETKVKKVGGSNLLIEDYHNGNWYFKGGVQPTLEDGTLAIPGMKVRLKKGAILRHPNRWYAIRDCNSAFDKAIVAKGDEIGHITCFESENSDGFYDGHFQWCVASHIGGYSGAICLSDCEVK